MYKLRKPLFVAFIAAITTALVAVLITNATDVRSFGFVENCCVAYDVSYDSLTDEILAGKQTDRGNDELALHSSYFIAESQLYYVAIPNANIIFQIQESDNLDFTPPDAVTIAFVGTLPQIRSWEYEVGRQTVVTYYLSAYHNHLYFYENSDSVLIDSELDLQSLIAYYFSTENFYARNIYAVVDMHNSAGDLEETLLRWVPYHFNSETNDIPFVGTWEQILEYNVVDISMLHPRLIPGVGDKQHFVLVETFDTIALMSLQCPSDWKFARPEYVEFALEIQNQEEPTKYVLVMYLFDNQHNLMGQYRRYGYQPNPITPYYTVLMIGTLYEIHEYANR